MVGGQGVEGGPEARMAPQLYSSTLSGTPESGSTPGGIAHLHLERRLIPASQNEAYFPTACGRDSIPGQRGMPLGFPTVLRFSIQLINSRNPKDKDRLTRKITLGDI